MVGLVVNGNYQSIEDSNPQMYILSDIPSRSFRFIGASPYDGCDTSHFTFLRVHDTAWENFSHAASFGNFISDDDLSSSRNSREWVTAAM